MGSLGVKDPSSSPPHPHSQRSPQGGLPHQDMLGMST